MPKVLKYLVPIACLAIGFFVGKTYTFQKFFDMPYYPYKFAGLYGIDEPCPDDPNDSDIALQILESYTVKDKSCRIESVIKVDGYYELTPHSDCVRRIKTPDESWDDFVKIPAFSFAFKPLDKNRITAKINGQPEQVFTRCHILREDHPNN